MVVALAWGWLGGTGCLAAQTITGQVVEGLRGTPVGSGFVVLVDPAGTELDRVLTSPQGRFAFAVPSGRSGPFVVRSERIGFAVGVSAPFTLEDGTAEVIVSVRALPTPLSSIEVRGETECRVRPGSEEQTAVVWEEARKALAAASWTAARQAFRIVSNVYDRDLDRRRRVTGERHRPFIGMTASPFRSRSPSALVAEGYVLAEEGAFAYYAPDGEVLQHDGFLATHCLRLRSGTDDRAGDIGLAFEPAPSRDLPDVEGVLWLDRASSELRQIEYRYTNLPRDLRSEAEAGGTLEFMALPSGGWIVHRWTIGIPTRFREERIDRFDRFPRRYADAFRDSGGEVLTIHDTTGMEVYRAVLAVATGVVLDSAGPDPQPLAGAIVGIRDAWFADTTDATGRYRVEAPLDGEYALTLTHPRTDSLAFALPDHPVSLARGRVDTVALAVPPLETIAARLCPDHATGASYRILVGTVRDSASGRPVSGVPVVASWQVIRSDFTQYRNVRAVATTDHRGTYVLCGMEFGRPAIVYATTGTRRSALLRVAFEAGGVEVGDLYHEMSGALWRTDLALPGRSAFETVVAGIVTDAITGRPLGDARITVAGGASAVSDSSGTVRLYGVPTGRQRITVRRPGYRSRSAEIDVEADEPTILGGELMALEPVPQVMGRVTDLEAGAPVARFLVVLQSEAGDSVALAPSDSAGTFVLTAPEAGTYYVTARHVGFAPVARGPFDLRPGEPVEVSLPVRRLAFALDPISVTADAVDAYLQGVGYYDRQVANRGYFMDREEVARRAGGVGDVPQLLATVPGLDVVEGVPGKYGSRMDFTRGTFSLQGCPNGPRIYVDGMVVENLVIGSHFDALGDVVQPIDIAAVEAYRTSSQLPVQYSGPEAACGVVLIWTLRGGSR